MEDLFILEVSVGDCDLLGSAESISFLEFDDFDTALNAESFIVKGKNVIYTELTSLIVKECTHCGEEFWDDEEDEDIKCSCDDAKSRSELREGK